MTAHPATHYNKRLNVWVREYDDRTYVFHSDGAVRMFSRAPNALGRFEVTEGRGLPDSKLLAFNDLYMTKATYQEAVEWAYRLGMEDLPGVREAKEAARQSPSGDVYRAFVFADEGQATLDVVDEPSERGHEMAYMVPLGRITGGQGQGAAERTAPSTSGAPQPGTGQKPGPPRR